MVSSYPQYRWIQESIDEIRAETEGLQAFGEDMRRENGLVGIVKFVITIPPEQFRGIKYCGVLLSTMN